MGSIASNITGRLSSLVWALSWALLLFLFFGSITAAELCVRVAATGAGNGSDWANALGAGFAPVRGNTYYLADGSYGAKTWDTPASGTSLITIRKATLASHGTNVGWNSADGDGEAVFSYWVFPDTSYWNIDGQTGGGPTSWTSGFGFRVLNTNGSDLCVLYGTVSHLAFSHIKLHSDRSPYSTGFKGTTGSVSDLTVSCCEISDIFGVMFHVGGWSNVLIEKCYFARNKSTAADHSEMASFVYTNSNLTWRWCLFDQIEGTAVFAGVNGGSTTGLYIYGNVLARGTQPMVFGTSHPLRTARIFNNTIVGNGSMSQGAYFIGDDGGGGSSSDLLSYNNLFYLNQANSFYTVFAHDWTFASDNVRSETGGAPQDKDPEILSGEAHGQDSTGSPFASYNADPKLTDYHARTNAGLDTGALLVANGSDMFGNPRGADGTWDRGAVEYLVSTSPVAPAITTQPVSLTVTAGQTATFAAVATGNPAPTYQWQKNGVAITGATAASYTTPAATLADNSAAFRVVASNSAGLATSSPATLTVNAPANQSPTLSAATATPAPVTAKTASLSATASDDGGEPALVYTWTASGPAAVTFSPNASNAAKASLATFSKAGSYTLTVTAKDVGNLTGTKSVAITVNATPTTLSISPTSASVQPGKTVDFNAVIADQFRAVLATQPTVAWTVIGNNTINAAGLFTAGVGGSAPSGGATATTYVVTATSGNLSGTAVVAVSTASTAGATGGGGCGGGAAGLLVGLGCMLAARRRR